jgi:Do/DeqQ family serine protease
MARCRAPSEEAALLRNRRILHAALALVLSSPLARAGASPPAGKDPAPPASRVEAGPYSEFHSPFARVAEQVTPGVVYVEVRKRIGAGRRSGPFDDFMHDFLPKGHPRDLPSSGSGFVMDPRGYILTNNHVIEAAEAVTATFLDGEKYRCEVVGVDPRTDVAVVRIAERSRTGKPFPALPLGDSDEIKIGDWAIAVGNPFGEQLAGTVTVGVVSAKGRSDLTIMGADIDLQDFIQTDASINFGNSGGPLVNIRGEVIGINSALNAQGQGIGFAIPINLAASVAQQLIATGHVRRGYLGINLAELTREMAEGKDWEISEGVLVTDVQEGSPAAAAGMQADDVIVEFDGKPVQRTRPFRLLVAGTEVGKRVKLKVFRAGKYHDVLVTLGEYDERTLAQAAPEERTGWLGLAVVDLGAPQVREKYSLEGEERGVVITRVEPDSPAAKKGLAPGALVLEIVNQEIAGLADYNRIRDELKDRSKPITLKVKEGGTVRYVALSPAP